MAGDFEITGITVAAAVDLRGIADLQVRAWGREPDAEAIRKRAAKLEEQLTALDSESGAMFLATRDGRPVGFCRVARDSPEPTHWWLIGIVVHPDDRRRGIGRALARAAIRYAELRGAEVIRSETHADNRLSIQFHEGLGFANDGPFTASDGDAKIAFSLRLL